MRLLMSVCGVVYASSNKELCFCRHFLTMQSAERCQRYQFIVALMAARGLDCLRSSRYSITFSNCWFSAPFQSKLIRLSGLLDNQTKNTVVYAKNIIQSLKYVTKMVVTITNTWSLPPSLFKVMPIRTYVITEKFMGANQSYTTRKHGEVMLQ